MIHNSHRLVLAPLKGTPSLGPMGLSSRRSAKILISASSHSTSQPSSAHPNRLVLPVRSTRSHASHPASSSRHPSHVRLKNMPAFEDHAMYTPTFPDSSESPISTRQIGPTEQPVPLSEQAESFTKRPVSTLTSPVSNSSPSSASYPSSISTAPSSILASEPTTIASSSSLPPPSSSSLSRPTPSTSPLSPIPSPDIVHLSSSNTPSSKSISESVRLNTDELAQLPADKRAYLMALQSISDPEELARFLNFAKAWVKVGKKVPEPAAWIIAGKLPLDDSLKILRSTRQYEIGRVPSSQVAQVLVQKLLEEIRKPKMIPHPVKSMAILERIYNLWPRLEDTFSADSSSALPLTSLSSNNSSSSSGDKAAISFVKDPLSWALLIEAYSLILKQDRHPYQYSFIEREQGSNSSSTFGIKGNLLSLRNYKLEDRLSDLSSTWSTYGVRDEKERASIEQVVDRVSNLDFNRFQNWFDMFKEVAEIEGGIWTWRHRLEDIVLGRVRSSGSPEDWATAANVDRLAYPCLPSVQSPLPSSSSSSSSSPLPPIIPPQQLVTTTTSSPPPPRLTPLILSFHIPSSSPASRNSSNSDANYRTTLSSARNLVSDLQSPFVRYPSDPILLLFAFRLAFRISPSDPDRSTLLSDLLSRVRAPVSWNRIMKLENEGVTGTVQRKRRQWTRKVVKEGLDELGGVLKGRSRLWENLLKS